MTPEQIQEYVKGYAEFKELCDRFAVGYKRWESSRVKSRRHKPNWEFTGFTDDNKRIVIDDADNYGDWLEFPIEFLWMPTEEWQGILDADNARLIEQERAYEEKQKAEAERHERELFEKLRSKYEGASK